MTAGNQEGVGGDTEVVVGGPAMVEEDPKYSYAGYVACGGRINEVNYTRVMNLAHESMPYEPRVNQAGVAMGDQIKITAETSGVDIGAITTETGIDPRCIYDILRNDVKPADVEYHHGSMGDQALLVESLRMLEQGDAVQAIVDKHLHIWFA